jgi:hypothetical protein
MGFVCVGDGEVGGCTKQQRAKRIEHERGGRQGGNGRGEEKRGEGGWVGKEGGGGDYFCCVHAHDTRVS